MWDVLCSLLADITGSHLFENDSFDFDIPESAAEFRWGVEIVRLFLPSWQDEKNRGVWNIPVQVENHLRQTSSKVAERKALFGPDFRCTLKKIFDRDLATYQLIAVNHVVEQGVENFKDLSPRKLRAPQLALGLLEKKLSKTLTLIKNRLESKLSDVVGQIPEGL